MTSSLPYYDVIVIFYYDNRYMIRVISYYNFDCNEIHSWPACPPGMSGDGKWCEYIDHCAIDNGGCDEAVTCTNMNPGRKCGNCPAGYQGNGIYCKKSSLCDSNNGGCSPLASCDESGGSVTCHCAPGYSGSGVGPEGCKPGETTCDLGKGFKGVNLINLTV